MAFVPLFFVFPALLETMTEPGLETNKDATEEHPIHLERKTLTGVEHFALVGTV